MMEALDGLKKQLSELAEHAYRKGYDACRNDIAESVKEVEEIAYQKGLDDAWKAAKKIHVMFSKDIEKIFGKPSEHYVYSELSASEAIAKIKAFEEQKKAEEEIKVGDEVYCLDENYKSVVTSVSEDTAVMITQNGKWAVNYVKKLHRTGRHFDTIEEVLKQLQEAEHE